MARKPFLCGLLAALLLAVPGAAHADYNTFDDETLNDVNAFGQEVPYASGDVRQFVASFDTSTYTLQPGEGGAEGNVNGCVEDTGAVFAGRTGWVRFDPAVDGRISVIGQTPGYDSIIVLRQGRQTAWRTSSFSDIRGQPGQQCSDINNAAGDEETALPALKGSVYHVMVGGKCPSREECENSNGTVAPGGPTTIRLTFTPDDRDQDGVPDTNDDCEGGERGKVTDRGCPDTDGDRIRDDQEGPGCVGQRGVPSDDPRYHGCFDGPDPPDPNAGPSVVIRSVEGNPDNTASTNVVLRLNWRKGTRQAFASNSAGDPDVEIPLEANVPWTLRAAGKSETREVKVTFRGPSFEETDDDTITLDVQPPVVDRALVVRRGGKAKRWFVGGRAADEPNGTGVRRVEVLDAAQQSIAAFAACSAPPCQVVTDQVRGLQREPVFLRATDGAGNPQVMRLSTAKCRKPKILVPEVGGGWVCVKLGQPCGGKNPPYWSDARPRLKCEKKKGRKKRTVQVLGKRS